jgi:hypothetical protein
LRISDQVGANRRSISAVCLMAIVIMLAQYLLPLPAIEGMQLLRLASIVALGAVTYAGTTYAAWVSSGRPDGPELEILTFAVDLRTRFKTLSCQG